MDSPIIISCCFTVLSLSSSLTSVIVYKLEFSGKKLLQFLRNRPRAVQSGLLFCGLRALQGVLSASRREHMRNSGLYLHAQRPGEYRITFLARYRYWWFSQIRFGEHTGNVDNLLIIRARPAKIPLDASNKLLGKANCIWAPSAKRCTESKSLLHKYFRYIKLWK